jgi:magnesium transporter
MNISPNTPSSGNSEKVILELIQYDRTRHQRFDQLAVGELIGKINPELVNWINVDGLSDNSILEQLQNHFNLHFLLVDDILNEQRPKAEEYDDYLFFTLKMLYRINGKEVEYEQVSFVLGNHYLISFQQKEGDLFDAFRERIRLDQGKVRKRKSDYLLYRLIDIIVDNYYNVLDKISNQIDEIEDLVHETPNAENFRQIQMLRSDLIYLRKSVYPLREALNLMIKGESGFVEEENVRYYSDVYDHVIQLLESIDTYKDIAAGLMDVHMNSLNTRLNEVMKVLTIMSTIFIPLTFVVGVYGMNFEVMPELGWKYGYAMVWVINLIIVVLMIRYFKFKKWF